MADGWWNLFGEITSCVAAYQPKGAADLASSYVNLFNPGTYNAAPGVAPTWNATDGWIFSRAGKTVLNTGIVANALTWTYIVKFAGVTKEAYAAFFGAYQDTSTNNFYQYTDPTTKMRAGNGKLLLIEDSATAGVHAIANKTVYWDGVPKAIISDAGSPSTYEIWIGRYNPAGDIYGLTGNIQAFTVYNTELTDVQIAAITTLMNALPIPALTGKDFDLSAVTFDSPVLENVTSDYTLTGKDLDLSAVTFDAPTLDYWWNTPSCRTCEIDKESRGLVINADMRGLYIDCSSEHKYLTDTNYSHLTGSDLTLAALNFESPSIVNKYWIMGSSTSVQYGGASTLDSDLTFQSGYTIIPGVGAITHRIRQHGYVRSVTLRTGSLSVVKFKVFRPNGANYDFIGESESVTYQAGTTTQTLSTPIECRPGDMLGLYIVSGTVAATTLANGALYKYGDISTTWSGGTGTGYYLSITGYGTSPYLVATGDSISAGYNLYQSFYDTGPAGTLTSEPWYVLRGLIDSSQDGGFEYQNHGGGGRTWAWVKSTGFVGAEATKAKVILIHCGVNDVNNARTWEQVVADIDAIKVLFAASTTATKLIIDEILPWSNGDDTQAATVRTWNANLAAWVTSNNDVSGKTITLALVHDAMGQTRVSTGELDDLITAYSGDGVHLSAAGYAKLAELLQPYMS